MRLLNTWTGEFECHSDPKEVRYAILSHVWRTPEEGGEQTFDDVQRIQADVKAAREEPGGPYPAHWPRAPILEFDFDTMNEPFPNEPRDIFSYPTLSEVLCTYLPDGVSVIFSAESPLSDKIKGLCKVARKAGFNLVWNDTCCIDKSSSAELSEAINSMYEWYRLSDMCYVYLADVPDDRIPGANRIYPFYRSRWHTRGWTLQELLAPERIEFLTYSWSFLGTKLGLAGFLSSLTRIDVNILLGRAPVGSASVAQRMSWAAKRKTTRVEDRAYSLMGLFGVHMSPIYGEGTNAFLRLQEEVIRSIPDQSIFTWKREDSRMLRRTLGEFGLDTTRSAACLLASSPTPFIFSNARPVALADFAARLHIQHLEDVPPLDCVFTPQGARMRLLCLNLTDLRTPISLILQGMEQPCGNRANHFKADRLALLQCGNEDGDLVGLAFHSSDDAGSGRGSLVGTNCDCSENEPFRTIWLPRNVLAEILECVKPVTAEVSLLRHRSHTPPSKSLLPCMPHQSLPTLNLWPGFRADSGWPGTAFALSPDSVARLRTLGFTVSPLQMTRGLLTGKISLKTTLAYPDRGLLHSIPLRLSLEVSERYTWRGYYVRICFSSAAPLSSPGLASSPTAISCRATDLEVPGSDSQQIQEVHIDDLQGRHTLAQLDLLIRLYPQMPPNYVQLLRLSLERHPDAGQLSGTDSSQTVFLVMDMSEVPQDIAELMSAQKNSGDTRLEDANDIPSKHHSTSEHNNDTECSSPRADASYSYERCYPDIDDSSPITALGQALSIETPEPIAAHCERTKMEGFLHATGAGSQADSSSTSPTLQTPSGGYIRNPDDDDAFQDGAVFATPNTTGGLSKNGSGGSVRPRMGDATHVLGNIVLETEPLIAPLAPAPVGGLTEISRSDSSEVGAPGSIAVATLGTTDDASSARSARGTSQGAVFELEMSTLLTVPEVARKRRRSASALNAEPSGSTEAKRARMFNHQRSAERSDPRRTADTGTRDDGAHWAPPPAINEPSAAGLRRALSTPPPSAESLPLPVPLPPSHLPDVVSDSADTTTAQYATLESVDALRRENSALRAQVSMAASDHAEMKSEFASLTTQNAALLSQMAEMSRRLDALAAAMTAMPSLPAHADAT